MLSHPASFPLLAQMLEKQKAALPSKRSDNCQIQPYKGHILRATVSWSRGEGRNQERMLSFQAKEGQCVLYRGRLFPVSVWKGCNHLIYSIFETYINLKVLFAGAVEGLQ